MKRHFILNVWSLKFRKHVNIWRELAKKSKNYVYKNCGKIDWTCICVAYIFFLIVITHSVNPTFSQISCSSTHFGGHFEETICALVSFFTFHPSITYIFNRYFWRFVIVHYIKWLMGLITKISVESVWLSRISFLESKSK